MKVIQRSLDTTLAQGLQQTAEYMDRCAASEGHLILFDRNSEKMWEQKGVGKYTVKATAWAGISSP